VRLEITYRARQILIDGPEPTTGMPKGFNLELMNLFTKPYDVVLEDFVHV
jgi:hypothetical protein